MVVDCGHCPACKQAKANYRAMRIVNSSIDILDQTDRFFVTLTYKNKFIPYVKHNELHDFLYHERSDLPVYRDKDVHLYFDRSDRQLHEREVECGVIDTYYRDDFESWYIFHPEQAYHEDHKFLRASGNRFGAVLYGRIGVSLYADVQRFFKRLRQNLHRSGYEGNLKYFACTEYGPTTSRNHVHLYIEVPKGHFSLVKGAIAKSWLYDSMEQRLNNIEEAIKPSEYLGSYINSDRTVSGVLQSNPFRQRHSYSQGFGFGKNAYTYKEVKKAILRRSLRTFEEINRNGQITSGFVPIPKYVISRYFPKWKGYFKLNSSQIRHIVEEPSRIYYLRDYLELTSNECKQIFIKLCNLKKLYPDDDYPELYSQVWTLRFCNMMEDFHRNMVDELESYDNIQEFYSGEINSEFVRLDERSHYEVDINKFKDIVERTLVLTDSYYKHSKDRKVKNLVYSQSLNT